MLSREEVIDRLKKIKPELQSKFAVKDLALFGSYSRNEQTSDSDVDVMVEFAKPVGIEFIDLVIYLEDFFQKRVDLVTKKALKPTLRPYVEPDLIYV
jgi:uncharacterized protein